MEAVTFSTGDGVRLEGEIRRPDDAPRGSAVLCHPHPKHGGSKDHPILWALRNELAGKRGLAVLGFNFRGVMGSGGTYGGGRDEIHDVRAAIGRIREETPERPTVLCGWSFGANVALREALDDPRVAALVLIGMPLRPNDLTLPALPDEAELRGVRRPALVLAGDNDQYCPVDDAAEFAASLPRGRLHIVDGADHYLWRREREAAAVVGDFVDEALGDDGNDAPGG
ncbi:MAG: alpha/beta hydrolase [Actinomycetota bacterium]